MRRAEFLLVLLSLPVATATVLSKTLPAPECTNYSIGRSLKVCTQLDKSALRGRSKSTKWKVWIEGDGNPIQVRLHNNSPGVVHLKGGDDQIVRLDGRRQEVQRKVTAVGTGIARLEARPYSTFPKQEATTIAASLARRLAEIEARFIGRRAKLPPDYPAQAVTGLLDSTEGELLDAMSYPELAALRDWVQEKFRKARIELGKPLKKSRNDLPFHSSTVLASVGGFLPLALATPRETPHQQFSKAAVDSAFDQIIQRMLRQLMEMAEQNDLTTSLCVTSEPGAGAKFLMRPRAIKEWTVERITVGDISVIYRGIYAYRMTAKNLQAKICEDPARESCSLINLIDDPQPIFHCDLSSEACTRKPGPLPATCKDHG